MRIAKNINKEIDKLEIEMAKYPAVNCPVTHTFRNGYYEREVFMEAGKGGLLIVSKIHDTDHEFVISEGVVAVKVNDGKWELLRAPYLGKTKKGTRRVLFVIENTRWRTFHKLEEGETTPEQVEERIIRKYDHPYVKIKKQMGELT